MGSSWDGSNDDTSIWPGIGSGTNSSRQLIQDGVDLNQTCAGPVTASGCTSGPAAYYYFWVEEYPRESMEQVTNLTPHRGDSVTASAAWAAGDATFQICDWTQNTCVNGTQSSPGPDNVSEWIVERPSRAGLGVEHLANYNYAVMSGAYYTAGGKGYSIALSPHGHTEYTMIGNGRQVISSVSSLASSGAGFTAYWKGFH